jgi:hypothetical protein
MQGSQGPCFFCQLPTANCQLKSLKSALPTEAGGEGGDCLEFGIAK